MPNKDNLVPLNQRSPEQARKIQSAGGTASGKARRRAKNMRELATWLLSADLEAHEQDIADRLQELGLAGDQQGAILLAAVDKAKGGDIESARYVRDTSGQAPAQVVGLAAAESSGDLSQMSEEELRKMAQLPEAQDDKNPE